MSSGITRRLISYFTLVIVVFAVVMGLIFGLSYQRQTKNTVKFDLQRYSTQIVAMVEESGSFEGHQSHVQELLESAKLDNVQVWVVDPLGEIFRLTPIKMGMGMMRDISNLNGATRALIGDVLDGKEVSTDNVRGVFDRDVLTVGTPIHDNGTIIGGLFISASADDINAISWNGVRLMVIALIIGVLIAVLLGYLLSKRFITPLQKANLAIDTLAGGNYTVKMSRDSDDEMGQLADNITILSSRLAKAKTQSDNLEKMRQNFIADITHELRTPVTVIRGLAEGVKDGVYEDPKAVSDQIITETLAMQRLIKDLLELSKLEDPDFTIERQPVELHHVLSDIIRSMTPLLAPKALTLSTSIAQGDWTLQADAQRLRQLFLIVLDNAVKYSPHGADIELKAEQHDSSIILSITDHGPGMTPEQLQTLFQRYHSTSGNGIGLALAKKIADRHGITIHVDSTVGSRNHTDVYIPNK
jgi:signal transduction histidine kinase